MDRSNITSFSFTVDDDLISNSSANTTFIQPRAFNNKKPFSKDFGPKGANGINHYDERPVPTIQKRIIEQAQTDAYRDMNNELFNPFQHRLNGGYIRQSDLYQRQKQRQIEMIRRKQMQTMNSAKNYTIVFHNNPNQSGNSLKMAANNILNENEGQSIGDYYNKKFQKNKVDVMNQIDEDDDQGNQVKKDNFIKSVKKSEKSIGSQIQPRKVTSSHDKNANKLYMERKNSTVQSQNQRVRLVKGNDGWKAENHINHQNNINKPESDKPKLIKGNEGWKPQKIHGQNDDSNSDPPRQVKTPVNVPKPVIKQQPKPIQTKNKQPEIKKIPANNQKSVTSGNKKSTKKQNTLNGKKKYSEVYDGPDRNLVEQLQKEITECPSITFDDIAELQTAKGLLQEAVLLPRMMPDFFKGIRKAMKGILLFGPPGTGKTLLAKAVASNNMFFNVSASSLASKWKGQSQKMVRMLFQMARYHSPSVIFFDQIDCIASKRSQNQHESSRKVKTQLLVQMDGVGSNDQMVFVLAATNRPWDLDQALRRRLEKRIYIPLPEQVGRRKMFDINLKQLKVSDKIDWAKILKETKGCSGADICNICRDAAYMPMRRKLSQVGGITKISQISQKQLLNEEITSDDLMEAAKKTSPSVNNDDLKKYELWMKQFGST